MKIHIYEEVTDEENRISHEDDMNNYLKDFQKEQNKFYLKEII